MINHEITVISNNHCTIISGIIIIRKNTSNMNDNKNNKKHSILILSPDNTEKENDEDVMCRKFNSDGPNLQVNIFVVQH